MSGCIGFDIGGANLKAAHANGVARSIPFPLWQTPEKLPDQLSRLLHELPSSDILAVTMTGELADCFATKAEGVRRILDSIDSIANHREVRVWSTEGRFVSATEAAENPLAVAAANWHANATWWGESRQIESGLLIDIGTTTTDIIPIQSQKPATLGLTDVTRLQAGELLYTGASRTPICAIVQQVPFHNEMLPVAAEWFSTSLDVALILEEIEESPSDCDTANHRPATREAAWDRLARQICCDRTECTFEDAIEIARFVRKQQLAQMQIPLERVVERHTERKFSEVLISGSGQYLARPLLPNIPSLESTPVIDLGELLSEDLASAACAYAVAKLCETRITN